MLFFKFFYRKICKLILIKFLTKVTTNLFEYEVKDSILSLDRKQKENHYIFFIRNKMHDKKK